MQIKKIQNTNDFLQPFINLWIIRKPLNYFIATFVDFTKYGLKQNNI